MALSKAGKNQVDQSASLTVDGDLTVDTTTLHVDSTNNRVGIGTNSPSVKLEIKAGNGNQLVLDNAGETYTQMVFKVGGTQSGTIWASATDFSMYTYSTQPIIFHTNTAERMRIDSSGRVTMPYQPAFLAYLVTTTGKATSISVVPGTFATNYNVGGHYSTSTKRFTAPVAGLYLFTGTIATEGGAGSFNYLSCEFWVNGSRTFIGGWQGNSSPSYSKSASSVVLSLSASDYVELACETNKAFNMQGGSPNYTYFNGYLVG